MASKISLKMRKCRTHRQGAECVGRGAGHVGCISGGQDTWAEGAGCIGCSSVKAQPGPAHHYLLLTAYIVLGNAYTMS